MGAFRDKASRAWEVDINTTTISRVRKRLTINLLELVLHNNELIDKLADPVLLVDVLFVLCEDQCQKAGVSDEDFGRALSRDNVEQGLDLILEGVVNFSPRALRPAYQKVLEKARKYETVQQGRVLEAVNSPQFEAAMEAELKKRLEIPEPLPTASSNAAGNSAASPGSIPAPSPSAS